MSRSTLTSEAEAVTAAAIGPFGHGFDSAFAAATLILRNRKRNGRLVRRKLERGGPACY